MESRNIALGGKYFACRPPYPFPPVDPGDGVNRSKYERGQRSGIDTIKYHTCQGYQWESNKLTIGHHKREPRGQPLPNRLPQGNNKQMQLFQNMVMLQYYQIKGNHECTQKVANILPADSPTPPTLEMWSISQNSTFSENDHVAYQIKWNHEI